MKHLVKNIEVKFATQDKATFCDIYNITIPKEKIIEWAKFPGIKVEFPIAIPFFKRELD